MAKVLRREVTRGDLRPVVGEIGKELLDTITLGMYTSPLTAVREYVQNAVDSIDVAVELGLLQGREARIDIKVDGRARTIEIEDNGIGVSVDKARTVLADIGSSEKRDAVQRGFRGIGRLGGLAYSRRVTFCTRASKETQVTEMEWNGLRLRELIRERDDRSHLAKVVSEIAAIKTRAPKRDEPRHFFRVTLADVDRFYADSMMNVAAIGNYLARVAPVPYDRSQFRHSEKVARHLAGVPGWNEYSIRLNGAEVFKPHRDTVYLGKNKMDSIRDVSLFEVVDAEGSLLARGWHAIMDMIGALPDRETMRGINVRQGNIEVGDVRFLEEVFVEPRFAKWNIGEVEVTRGVRPNSRRDGFEQSPKFERILAELTVLGRHLSVTCREASSRRSRVRLLAGVLDQAEQLLRHSIVFLDSAHAFSVAQDVRLLLDRVKPAADDGSRDTEIGQRYRLLSRKLAALQKAPSFVDNVVDARRFGRKGNKELLAEVCRNLVELSGVAPASTLEMLSKITSPYMKHV